MSKCLIIIPAYNEEKSIGQVLSMILSLQLKDVDVLVVNDGSRDLTVETARQFPVHVISHPTNLGYAAALQTGYRYAESKDYEFVVQFDADGQHDSRSLAGVIRMFKESEADMIIGSRFLGESSMHIGFWKRLAMSFFSGLIKTVTQVKITDPTSGFKGYRKHVYQALITTDQFPIEYPDSNFIIQLLLNKYRIVEVPVQMQDRQYGTGMHVGIRPLLYVFQILLSTLVIYLKFKFKLAKRAG